MVTGRDDFMKAFNFVFGATSEDINVDGVQKIAHESIRNTPVDEW
jgi:hypothetical protein